MIFREISAAWTFFRQEGFKTTLLSRDTPFLIQFGKYGVCGVLSVFVLLTVVWLGRALFPASFTENLPEATRATHNTILHFIAFVPSNVTAYLLNRWLVFTPGKHTVSREFWLFTLISLISFALGQVLPQWLVRDFGVANAIADLSFIISSALVNFSCRKLLVFEK